MASRLGIPVAHVEAGVRASRRDQPEEANRIIVDRLSDLLFCPSKTAVSNLAKEGITEGVTFVGDVMFDILLATVPVAERRLDVLEAFNVRPRQYVLATLHRSGNTDAPGRLRQVFEGLARVAKLVGPVVMPLHPRTRKALEEAGDHVASAPGIRIVEPVGYVEMLALEQYARCILTDSGGVQKEAYWLGIPCVTLREETEWPETLEGGWNILAGTDPDAILRAAARPAPSSPRPDHYGQGDAACAVIRTLLQWPSRRGC